MSLRELFARGSTGRRVLLWLAAAAAVLVYTQLLLPGSAGSEQRGTPAAILFRGLVLGLVNGLTVAGLILVYRSFRIINFAQAAFGVVGATLIFQMVQLSGVPFFVALPIGLVLSAGLGILFEIGIVRAFFNASRLVLTVATIAAAILIASAGPQLISQLPFIPTEGASLEEAVGTAPIRPDLPFAGFTFTLGGLGLEFGFPEVFAIEVVIIALVLVGAFFRYTTAGVAVRALAENSERSALLGISVGAVSMIVWAISGALGGTAATLTGAILTPGVARGFAPSLLLPALAAAVIAGFRSIPAGVAASVAISIVARSTEFSLPEDLSLVTVALFVVIGLGLLFTHRRGGRSEEGSGASWQAVEEQRPIPKELVGVGSIRTTRYALIAIGVIAVLAYPFLVDTGPVVLGANIAITTIVILSLVVLTGWAGQMSLGQYGFVAVGAVVAGAVNAKVGIPFWFAVPIGAAVSGAVAVVVGLPALRLRGLFLAITTFAFGMGIAAALFNRRYFGWLLADDVARPRLFFIDFNDETSMYYLSVVALILAVLVLYNLRRSRFGRVLIALRENEPNVEALGINVVRTKLSAFAVSGAIAGFAGAIFAFQQRGLAADSFAADFSVNIFIYAVLGGVSSVAGALLGSAAYNATTYFVPTTPIWQAIFTGSGPALLLLMLFVSPGGLIGIVNKLRDSALRIVAQRRQLVVPSLFADYDPDALEKQLIPLSEASDVEGLAALPTGEFFALESDLYEGRGVRIMDRLEGPRETTEQAALGAASYRVQDDLLVATPEEPES